MTLELPDGSSAPRPAGAPTRVEAMASDVLHLEGPVLVGPYEERPQAWVVQGRITYDQPPGATSATTIRGWVLPGLVDAHCHVGLDAHGAVDEEATEQQALTDRDAGALLIRDAGSPADTRWVDDRDDLPRIIRAGRHIARPKRYIRGFAVEVDPDDVVMQVREQARAGDGWVKLVGDWIDRETGDLSPSFPRETVVAAVAAAHEEGARITAHCFGEESLHDLVAAGIDCVEHATGLEPETIAAFAALGTAIVPTLVNIATFPAVAEPARERFPRYHAHMLDLHARRHSTVAAAHEAGIAVYVGTDAGGSLAHGLVAEEVLELTRAGLTPVEALSAATWGAREWLGRPGLDEGAPADLVVYETDPRVDVRALAAPYAIVLRGVRLA